MNVGKRQSGSIIFPLVIALTISALSIFYFYYNSFQLRKLEDQKLIHVSNLTAYEYSIKALLNSQGALMSSAALPANGNFLKCLNDPEFNCNGPKNQKFTLMNENGSIFNDPTSPTNGIDSGTLPCTSFPSISCPFRYELSWSYDCVGLGPCYSPDMTIQGKLFIGDFPSVKFNINTVNYDLLVKIR